MSEHGRSRTPGGIGMAIEGIQAWLKRVHRLALVSGTGASFLNFSGHGAHLLLMSIALIWE